MKLSSLAALLFALAAAAQAGDSFPPSSVAATARELAAHLSGKSFGATYANGTKIKTRFEANGNLAASAPGFSDTGRWKAEEGKLCGSLQKGGEFCNEARFDAGVLYLRRMNGEVIRYEPEQ